jgi:hypothetical protein
MEQNRSLQSYRGGCSSRTDPEGSGPSSQDASIVPFCDMTPERRNSEVARQRLG